ncbi:hypothetical protein BGZ52_003508 [Haplosporangium bisporale]|nr:hypothetical protein BGZ52_003508 [Haplosporangium bisporale]
MVKAKADAICDTYFRNTEILMTQFNNVDVNAAIFIRDMMVYMELSSSIKAGDVGRILNVMRMITIMFQGGNIPNYAKALMRFIAGARHKWHPKKTRAILSTMVVNTRGTENSFIPTDLYQEHNNFLTKAVHAAKAGNMRFQESMETQDTNQSRLLDVGDSEATDSSDMEGIDDYLGDLDGPNNSDNDLSDGLSDEEDFNDIDPKKCE